MARILFLYMLCLHAFIACELKAQVALLPDADLLHCEFSDKDIERFQSPEKVFYPETWFHYIGGNVSKEGIKMDLEAIASAGFSGIHLFHGKFGSVWPGTKEQIACLSPQWEDMVKFTANECRRLGLRFTMQGCPGWAMAGGPWIQPSNAMRHLVWSRTDVKSGKVRTKLFVPKEGNEKWRDYKDVMVLAFPLPKGDTGKALLPEKVTGNDTLHWNTCFFSMDKPLKLAPLPKESKPYWVEISFQDKEIIRTLELPSIDSMNHEWCYEPGVHIKMEAVDEEDVSQTVLDTELPAASWQDDQPISLCCIEAGPCRKYRIYIENRHEMYLNFLRLYSAARKNNWESEAGWTLRTMERKGDSIRYSNRTYLHSDKILDLTKFMKKDGTLVCDLPSSFAKQWSILRIGNVNTGMKNAPAPEEATGWECDKFSIEGSDAQFDNYLGKLAKDALSGGLLNGALFDSWECKTQTWTPNMESEFAQRTGYSLRKWLPAVMGYVIDDPETTTRFLNDWRRVLNDLLVHNFFGNMAKRANECGMSICYETACGDIFPGDILEYFKFADVPMCEIWQPLSKQFVGSTNYKPVRPTASAAHIYGKPRVAAEAFTSFEHTWNEHWGMLKEVANIKSVEGITHMVFHTYTHNPQIGFPPPGTSFSGANIGTPFLRGQTWWKYMPEFTTYLARCSYLLERGKPIADILWYLGDEIDHKPDQNSPFLKGYNYDYCNRDALLNRIFVDNGELVTPEGLHYRVLWLPETTRMTPATLDKLYELMTQGAIIVGNAPVNSATLVDGEEGFSRFNQLVKKIWGNSKEKKKDKRAIGKGYIFMNTPLQEVLDNLEICPDVDGGDVLWLHRSTNKADWYFITLPQGKEFDGELEFRNCGHVEIWNPLTGKIMNAPYVSDGKVTKVKLKLSQREAYFVVFRKDKKEKPFSERKIEKSITLQSMWTLNFPSDWGISDTLSISVLKPWKELNVSKEGKAFSGTVEYTTSFYIEQYDVTANYELDLGEVDMIAEIVINEQRVGVLWDQPYRLDISPFLKEGKNQMLIRVTSTWYNRLVFDASQPEKERKTWVLKWPEKNAILKNTGLMGPVKIQKINRSQSEMVE